MIGTLPSTFRRKLLAVLAVVACLAASLGGAHSQEPPAQPPSDGKAVSAYLFWSPTCPHCLKAKTFLETLAKANPAVRLHALEVGNNEENNRAFMGAVERFGIERPGVPLITIGDKVFIGYGEDATTGAELRAALDDCRRRRCADVGGDIVRAAAEPSGAPAPAGSAEALRPQIPTTVSLPLIGEIDTRTLSLPVLTIVLGFVDGFNPCAMWALVFLIGLLVGMKDPVRMWTYGLVFLVTSAVVYLAFMAAWLNVFMFLGSLGVIRIAIGVFALGAAGYYLWQFWSNPDAACPVTSSGERQHVMARFREVTAERSFLVAIAGIIVLAALVNLIELLCSAGIPAIYTQVLALSDLSRGAYAGYLLLYISVFLIDDIIVFVMAMLTLQAAGLAATYSRYSHLLGGVVLAAVGFMLLFRPDWLAFA